MDNTLIPFIREFAKAPTVVASVIPSGKALARQMAAPIPSMGQPVVVELGSGTGAFSRAIQERLDGRGRHIALDINDRFTALLTERFAGLDAVTADARDVSAVLAERGLRQADAIVSGLPWASFRHERQRELLDAVVDALSPQGAFTTFAYVHARRFVPARRLRRSLADRFEEVVLGRTVWANLPPALVYHCRRPLPRQRDHRTAGAPGHAVPAGRLGASAGDPQRSNRRYL
ncbi:class I SAM-dependent methyltransferase [Streptomyces sp. NPDC050988]|uniref:class I SAM-dependent methyltransferase n=1 Tax=Streptomyces sp. NPDC050988 TaxID=3365637 RepID=UPI0037BCDD31